MHVAHPHDHMHKRLRALARAAAVLVISLAAAMGLLVVFTRPTDAQTIVRGVSVSGIAVGGLSRAAATTMVRQATDGLTLAFRLGDKTFSVGANGIATFDVETAMQRALSVGQDDTRPFASAVARISALGWGDDVEVPVTLDDAALRSAVGHAIGDDVSIAKDASFSISLAASERGEPSITVNSEREGKVPDFDRLARDTEERIRTLSNDPIVVRVRIDSPKVRAADAEALIDAAKRAVMRAPLSLTADDERWSVSRATIADWIVPHADDDGIRLGTDHERVRIYLTARATSVTTTPKDAQFEEKDGRVTLFVPGVNGQTLDIDDAVERIEHALVAEAEPATRTVALAIKPVPPEITTEKSNPYGIKEIIGVGESNFQGSPKNRRHNIAVGSKAVNGTIVPAGEEFSMLKTLGAIDASTGYLEELVIKGNKTTPEYGGGLCQIGSTAFRGALDSGMPITQRQNHSYRVSYYERDGAGKYIGPGKDATIYDPAPDFRFKNDTQAGILIRTEIDGNTLRFVFWGARDGRVASQTDARVYNVVPPPEKKVTETDDLKPGEEKCTEKPHPGSDAIFTYTVAFPDGTERVVDFKSHYRPWQEVCLIGRDPNKPLDTSVTDPGVISADASGAAGSPVTP